MQDMRIFQIHHLEEKGETMEDNKTENDTAEQERIDITPDLKETAWKVAKGLLDFSTRAVFYIPGRKDHVAMKILKGGALLHSAYSAWEKNKDDESDENEKVNSVPEHCEGGC